MVLDKLGKRGWQGVIRGGDRVPRFQLRKGFINFYMICFLISGPTLYNITTLCLKLGQCFYSAVGAKLMHICGHHRFSAKGRDHIKKFLVTGSPDNFMYGRAPTRPAADIFGHGYI